MNYALVLQIIGRLCVLLGSILAAMALLAFFSPGDHDNEALGFISTALIAFVMWGASLLVRGDNPRLRAPDGFACVTGGWVLTGLLGALPYYVSGAIPSFTDAVFESVSGFTTTGASILRDVESMPASLLLWRSLTQWLGGMGIVALFVALLPALSAGGNFLFQAEVPGPTPGRIKPRISQTAKTLWIIYIGLTLIEVVLLSFAGMSLFDAINHSFTNVATGGFSTNGDSLAGFSPAIQWIVIVFMFLGGVNFAMHFLLLRGEWRSVLRNQELRMFVSVVVIAAVLIASWLWLAGDDNRVEASDSGLVRHTLFQVFTTLTGTGYHSTDYDAWPGMCRMLLVILMFFGACAGSTSGGIKLARIMVLFKVARNQVRRVLHPSAVLPIKFGRRNVELSAIDATVGFFLLFMALFAVGSLILLGLGENMTTAVSGTIASLSNIGPGLGDVGPCGNYADVHTAGKWVFALLMLLGRLEIYSVVLLLVPALWRK